MTGALVAGIGFRRGTEAEEIAELIERALVLVGAARSSLAAVATADDRASDAAIRAATAWFGLAPHPIAAAALEARDAEIVTRSARIERLRGVGSLAEAAALAGAGPRSRLALPRIASGGATCALAVRYDTTRES
ncbi:cobalamin biosynthesis protein [Methylobacterium sp. yr668]|uniref:cobalamin biosynthesis protein n=1 Tax=Methylobacterium sp. yr668 TaxID=1761801 RepID=UPI0008E6B1C5|nr:cobalamin biosynthesis protein [Methylobacterium sp. yr668]SFS93840.1 cobalt-precorrin 5A hydrolase [Methylobacterium sp. yr668]